MKKQFIATLSVLPLLALNGCASGSAHNVPKRTVENTTTSSQASNVMNQQIKELLTQYDWHESGTAISKWTTRLPKSYALQPGNVPIGLYWGYHNVLSNSVGLDITPYLGQTVEVLAIPLKENWKIGPPPEPTYSIVITHENQVIGMWISKGQEKHIVDICESLSHKEFGELTGQTWGQWVSKQNLVDYNDPFYSKMAHWTPEQLFQAYYSAINKHQYDNAYAMMSTFEQYQYMIMNVPVGHLYQTQWNILGDGLSNWKTAKFLGMKPYHLPVPQKRGKNPEEELYNAKSYASKNYTVTFDATVRKVIVMGNGKQTYFSGVVRESSGAPWTIAGFGTGP